MFWLTKCSKGVTQVEQYDEWVMSSPRWGDRKRAIYLAGGKLEEVRNVSCEFTPSFSNLGFAFLSANPLCVFSPGG